jgi:hypothetical protein
MSPFHRAANFPIDLLSFQLADLEMGQKKSIEGPMAKLGLEQLLAVAREAFAGGDVEQAQLFYEQAVRKAELNYGEDNPAVGLVLIELLEVYEVQNDTAIAAQVFDRIRNIIVHHGAPELSKKFRQHQQKHGRT